MDTFGGYFWWILLVRSLVSHVIQEVQQQATDQTKSAQQMPRHPAAQPRSPRLTNENTEVPLQPYGKKNAKK